MKVWKYEVPRSRVQGGTTVNFMKTFISEAKTRQYEKPEEKPQISSRVFHFCRVLSASLTLRSTLTSWHHFSRVWMPG